MERISGPVNGYFIAAYTVESGDEHVGFAKICIARPEAVHGINAQHKVRGHHLYPSAQQALDSAEFRAKELVSKLPPNWHPFGPDTLMNSIN